MIEKKSLSITVPAMLKSKTLWSAIASLVAAVLVALVPELDPVQDQLIQLIGVVGFGVVSKFAVTDWIYVFVHKDYPEKYK